MMLNTDITLAFNADVTNKFQSNVAGNRPQKLGKLGQICGRGSFSPISSVNEDDFTCALPLSNSTTMNLNNPSTFTRTTKLASDDIAVQITNYIGDLSVFLKDFEISYTKMSHMGFQIIDVNGVSTASEAGNRLGTLRQFDLNRCMPSARPSFNPTEDPTAPTP